MTNRAAWGVPEVRAALDHVTAEQPDRVDRRASGRLAPRYAEHGSPACLSAAVMHRLGVSLGVLKALDQEAGREGGGVVLRTSQHPIRRRFAPEAWELLGYLQSRNDRAWTWEEARRAAFTIDPYWADRNPRYALPGPWCTPDNQITPEDNR